MAQNFLSCDRDQPMLLPPDLREWLPEDHLAWFVLDAVAEMNLERFFAGYRHDGWGRAAHDPEMMVALLLYAYAVGERSSRRIERRCSEDVAFRVIAANQVPDHATIARFRARHAEELAELFSEVLVLCRKAGLVSVGTLALDGTRIAADAADRQNRTYEQLAKEILEEAAEVDAAEDEKFGDKRGDELPGDRASAAASACATPSAASTKSTRPSRRRWPPGRSRRPSTPREPATSARTTRPSRARSRRRRASASTSPTPTQGR